MEKEIQFVQYNIPAKCHICGKEILVSKWGDGECEHCGWRQGKNDAEFPDKVICPNKVSFNKAKRLIVEGKPIKPSFEDFIEGYNFYGEMLFYYKGRRYGLMRDPDCIVFYEWHIIESLQEYQTIEEFCEKANINGKLLSDIWNEVEDADYM